MIEKDYDYSIHSDFLIHWTGKDIEQELNTEWPSPGSDKSKTDGECEGKYIKRLQDILKYGLWMTTEPEDRYCEITIPATPKCCFTELKISESRKHARQYGRLGIGVKRPFLFNRSGRPLTYFGFRKDNDDIFLKSCGSDLQNKDLLNFFKPMNSDRLLNYDLYSESEWRVIFFESLLSARKIIDPRDPENVDQHAYFNTLGSSQQEKLKYLIPLDGWFSMIIYPSISIKNKAQKETSLGIISQIEKIKSIKGLSNSVESSNWPIEMDLDSCRHF